MKSLTAFSSPRALRCLPLLLCGLLLTACKPGNTAEKKEIAVLCAASQRVPLEEAAKAFEAEGHGKIVLQFGGSQSLLSTLEVAKKGDLFVPADRSYLDAAKAKGLTGDEVELTTMQGVVAVKKGNPKGIRTLADLQRADVRLVLANPDLAAISNITGKVLAPDAWKNLTTRAVVMKPTVTDAANDVVLGAADAAIVWDVSVTQGKDLERVDLPELAPVIGRVSGSVALASANPDGAKQFLQWLATPEKGGAILKKHGYGSTTAPAQPAP